MRMLQSLSLVLLPAVLLAGVSTTDPCLAQGKGKPPPQPPQPKLTPEQQKLQNEIKKRIVEHQKAMKALLERQRKALEANMKGHEAAHLTSAFLLLASANSDYNGHKGRAMHHLEHAIRHLDASILNNGTLAQRQQAMQSIQKTTGGWMTSALHGTGVEKQVLSDAQVLRAGHTVLNVQMAMAQHKQREAVGHVQSAVQEIERALVFSARESLRGKEAHVLTAAYVLMAAANHDYDGHRARAMGHVGHVVNHLNRDLMARGSLDQKVQAMKDAIAKGVVREQANQQATVHERQAVSDYQMMVAGALVQHVAMASAVANQPWQLQRMSDALTEISVALSIR
jgi:hypothetical protein